MLLRQLSTENNSGNCRRCGSGHEPEIDSQQPLIDKLLQQDRAQGRVSRQCAANWGMLRLRRSYPAAGVQWSLRRQSEPWMVPFSHPGSAIQLQRIWKGFASMMEVRDEAGDGPGGNVSGRDQRAGQGKRLVRGRGASLPGRSGPQPFLQGLKQNA